MITDFRLEQIAEELTVNLDFETLKSITEEGFSEEELKYILETEYSEETFNDEDIINLNEKIVRSAGWYYDTLRQNAYDELDEAITGVIEEYSDNLEKSDIASVLVEIASIYIRPKF